MSTGNGRAARVPSRQVLLQEISEDLKRMEGHIRDLDKKFELVMQTYRENNTSHKVSVGKLAQRISALEEAKG